jgi:limonene 1,2-monooxygenase
MRRDLELIEALDQLGFDEAWIGEHHSAAWENIADPALIIAAAGERTKYIRLGSGVVSLPYHHPMMVADRFVQLDYMTNGRAMLGVGPGALISDATMKGIDPLTQRGGWTNRWAIIRLIGGESSRTCDWFDCTAPAPAPSERLDPDHGGRRRRRRAWCAGTTASACCRSAPA